MPHHRFVPAGGTTQRTTPLSRCIRSGELEGSGVASAAARTPHGRRTGHGDSAPPDPSVVMIALVLLFLLVSVSVLAAWLAVSRGSVLARHRELQIRRDEITNERDRLTSEVSQLRVLDGQRLR